MGIHKGALGTILMGRPLLWWFSTVSCSLHLWIMALTLLCFSLRNSFVILFRLMGVNDFVSHLLLDFFRERNDVLHWKLFIVSAMWNTPRYLALKQLGKSCFTHISRLVWVPFVLNTCHHCLKTVTQIIFGWYWNLFDLKHLGASKGDQMKIVRDHKDCSFTAKYEQEFPVSWRKDALHPFSKTKRISLFICHASKVLQQADSRDSFLACISDS